MFSIITAAIVGLILTIFPIVMAIVWMAGKPAVGIPYLFGAATFFVTQVLIRMPILSALEGLLWFKAFQTFYPILSILLYSFSAGLFEEGGRWLTMRFLMPKRRSWRTAVAFGLGHGCCEAIWLVGVNLLAAVALAHSTVSTIPPANILMMGLERVFAIAAHVGLSLLVMWAVMRKKPLVLVGAICLHGVFNTVPQLLIQFGWSEWTAELVLCVLAVISVFLVYKVRDTFPDEEEENIYEVEAEQ